MGQLPPSVQGAPHGATTRTPAHRPPARQRPGRVVHVLHEQLAQPCVVGGACPELVDLFMPDLNNSTSLRGGPRRATASACTSLRPGDGARVHVRRRRRQHVIASAASVPSRSKTPSPCRSHERPRRCAARWRVAGRARDRTNAVCAAAQRASLVLAHDDACRVGGLGDTRGLRSVPGHAGARRTRCGWSVALIRLDAVEGRGVVEGPAGTHPTHAVVEPGNAASTLAPVGERRGVRRARSRSACRRPAPRAASPPVRSRRLRPRVLHASAPALRRTAGGWGARRAGRGRPTVDPRSRLGCIPRARRCRR